jgi:hypothetical protein
MAAFQFYFQSGKQRKIVQVGDDDCVVFGKKNSLVKRKFKMMHYRAGTAGSFVDKVWGNLCHSHAVTVKYHSNMWN